MAAFFALRFLREKICAPKCFEFLARREKVGQSEKWRHFHVCVITAGLKERRMLLRPILRRP